MSQKREPCSLDGSHAVVSPEIIPVDTIRRGPVKKSKSAKWRMIVLVGIHVAIALHVWHWTVKGSTLSPLEPSEAMYTVARGLVNAGAVLLILALVSTLLFGRFFCGWACHLVAIQDACAWLMKKCGVRPKPLRSRTLMWVPLLAGLYMFVASPIGGRIMAKLGILPDFVLALKKSEFWETFPGITGAVITFFVCGVAMIWLLGSKGFCTYACPYGGLFGVIEKVAPWRIRVTDACKACGHCTVACTSNVLVHREVLEYGMVVDAGCMKCTDCISVCPENALYFGFGKIAVGAKPIRPTRARVWDYSIAEEIGLVAIFAAAMIIFVGLPHFWAPWAPSLYGRTALLLGLGISAMTAFMVVGFVRMLRRRDAALQSWVLKANGKWTGKGRIVAGSFGVYFAWLIASGGAQAAFFVGQYRLETYGPAIRSRDLSTTPLTTNETAALATADAAFAWADRLSFGLDLRAPSRRSGIASARGDREAAIKHLERALAIDREFAPTHVDLARLLVADQKFGDGASHLIRAIELDPEDHVIKETARQYSILLWQAGSAAEASAIAKALVQATPGDLLLKLLWCATLIESGKEEEAKKVCDEIAAAKPTDPNIHRDLGQIRARLNDVPAAIRHLEAWANGVGNSPEAFEALAEAYLVVGKNAEAEAAATKARALRGVAPK